MNACRFYASLLLTGLAALGPTGSAMAEATDPIPIFERMGLMGVWMPDCSQPPSQLNPRVTYERFHEGIAHTVSFDGKTVAISDEVGDAKVLDPRTVVFVVRRAGQPALTVTLKVVKDRILSDRSVGNDGHIFVDHGITLLTGKPVLSSEKCAVLTS